MLVYCHLYQLNYTHYSHLLYLLHTFALQSNIEIISKIVIIRQNIFGLLKTQYRPTLVYVCMYVYICVCMYVYM